MVKEKGDSKGLLLHAEEKLTISSPSSNQIVESPKGLTMK